MPEKKNVYLTLHKNFVRTDIEYTDKSTGEQRTFNQVTLPKGTTIDGTDVGCYQFSPLYVNESRFKGENYRDIPLLSDREVWLRKTVLDAEGNPVLDEDGKPERDTLKVMPESIREAVEQHRRDYVANKRASLDEMATSARDGAERLAQSDPSHARSIAR